MAQPVSNPPNPWAGPHVEWLGPPPDARLEVFEEDASSILTRNDSPDVPFDWSVNPYRGCQHACAYCYARRSHTYLDFGAGSDFEKKIVVKRNAPERLAEELGRRSWNRDWVAFSGITDAYQPLEASYRLTRRCLEVCLARYTPVGIVTKSALIRRDAELLSALNDRAGARVWLSIPFADPGMARAIEPAAATPEQRFEAIAHLHQAGVPVGVLVAPVIPALGDSQIPEILERAHQAGASAAGLILLRLPGEVREVFEQRLRAAYPDRAGHVLNALEECRRGLNQAERAAFGQRMAGHGARWETIEQLFRVHARRLGLEGGARPAPSPPSPTQQSLFRD